MSDQLSLDPAPTVPPHVVAYFAGAIGRFAYQGVPTAAQRKIVDRLAAEFAERTLRLKEPTDA